MRRQATGLLTASPTPIAARQDKRNPVMRIGAFTEVQSEKAASELECAPTVAAKSRSKKSIILSQGMETIGVEPLPPRLVNWQSDIRASVSQYQCGPRANIRWGPRGDHFTVGTVNMVETVLMGMPFTFQRSDPHG